LDLRVWYLDLDLNLDLLFEYLDLCLALRVECLDLDLDLGLKCLLTTLLKAPASIVSRNCKKLSIFLEIHDGQISVSFVQGCQCVAVYKKIKQIKDYKQMKQYVLKKQKTCLLSSISAFNIKVNSHQNLI